MADLALHVTDVRFTPSRPDQEATGFLGLIRFTVNDGLGVDGIALRRNTGGELYISYPSRVDRSGQRHPLVRPLGDGPRREIEDQVFRALGLAESSR